MMRFLIFALFAFLVGCGDDSEPEDVPAGKFTQADAAANCAESNARMQTILGYGCHVCDPMGFEVGNCFDERTDVDVTNYEVRHVYRVIESGDYWECSKQLVPVDERESVRADICE